ncbi:condensation domain-containing protein, partial [Nocardia sp. NPDC052001]|uniref:condensation domain-containing protein n=1 Tax=Nocardia sp. NPDC052001 TaxID=3154853 RepID=UPI0034213DF5
MAALGTDVTAMLLGDVPARLGMGVNEILLTALALALAEHAGHRSAVAIDVESHGRVERLGDDVDLSRTVGWFTAKYPVSLRMPNVDWVEIAGDGAALGAVVKDLKQQLRVTPEGVTFGLLRYVRNEAVLDVGDPQVGFNYHGRSHALDDWTGEKATPGVDFAAWQVRGLPVELAAAADMTLLHTVEINAAAVDTEIGARLQAAVAFAAAKMDRREIESIVGLWFAAVEGICRYARQGGSGLVPADLLVRDFRQSQIDELESMFDVADILPLAPLQEGLLFHAAYGDGSSDLYATQLDLSLVGELDVEGLRAAVQSVANRHPQLNARFVYRQFLRPVQVVVKSPAVPWRFMDLAVVPEAERDRRLRQLAVDDRTASCDLDRESPFRVSLVRVAAGKFHLVVTVHHIVLDGWSLPILLAEIFGAYRGESLAAPVPYRNYLAWVSDQDANVSSAVWRAKFAGFEEPTIIDPIGAYSDPLCASQRFFIPESTTRALDAVVRQLDSTMSTVLHAAWSRVL